MEQIIAPQENVLRILNKPKTSAAGYRLSKYCVPLETEHGFLLFNVLTRELVLLSAEEYASILDNGYLREHWFVIPEALNEREYADLVRWVLPNMQKKSNDITGYTILTTTDCNARCFYCYEKGCKPVSMTEETARKVVRYIKEHCNGEKVRLSWFGGEPLVNYPVIDLICSELAKDDIEYSSFMISNGYLFDDIMISKATAKWNLKQVQITLDGTEDIYNRSKAYIYKDGSAYQVVTRNIERLLEAGISIVVRLNISIHNANDLLALVDELAVRFPNKEHLRIYSHLLFDIEREDNSRYSHETRELVHRKKKELDAKLFSHGLSSANTRGLKRKLPINHCMADNDHAIVIVPDGHIGLCEHYCESEFIGHIDSPSRNEDLIRSWKEPLESHELCENCFYYPSCVSLKKCPNRDFCTEFRQASYRLNTEHAMRNELNRWLEGCTQEVNEESSDE